jgi:trimeric autotransporter adhesin
LTRNPVCMNKDYSRPTTDGRNERHGSRSFHAVWTVVFVSRNDEVRVQRSIRGVIRAGALSTAMAMLAATAQMWAQAPASATSASGVIRGTVKAGALPLPGVAVTATDATGKKYATTTDITGAFAMAVPSGKYSVEAELAAFAEVTQQVVVDTANGKAEQVAEFGLQLASRVPPPVAAPAKSEVAAGTKPAAPGSTTPSTTAATTPRRRSTRQLPGGAGGRGVQSLSVEDINGNTLDASTGSGDLGVQIPTVGGIDSSDPSLASDTLAVSGAQGQTNGLAGLSQDQLQQRIQEFQQQAQANGGDVNGQIAIGLGGLMGGNGFGGPGGGPGGGFGGPGGGRGGGGGGRGGGGGFRGMNPTQPHGSFAYTGSNNALNAIPFSVQGTPVPNPPGDTNTLIASITGTPFIPHLTKPNPKQFVFLSVQETRNTSSSISSAIVPTAAERSGDFSGLPTIYNPATGAPFGGGTGCANTSSTNCIPTASISNAAQALLSYYPLPNITPTGAQNNFQTITTGSTHSSQISARYNRSFGQAPTRGGGRGGGGAGGARGGGQRQNQNAPKVLRQSIAENFAYSHSASATPSFSPLLGGKSSTEGYSFASSYTIGYGRINSTATLNWNRSHSLGSNYFTNATVNPAQALEANGTSSALNVGGVPSIYGNPFYFGIPSISLTQFSGLSDATPSEKVSQTISFTDFVAYRHGKHNLRVGGDIRRIHADSIGGTAVLGSFSFSGFATESLAQQQCVPSTTQTCSFPAAGSPVADLLLGLPLQTGITAGLNKIYLRANVLDWYVQDDYRVKANVTLNLGLRWEYFSPYVEKYNRLTNLTHNADFTQISQVCATTVAGCAAGSPRSLVNPDRIMYSPRIGIAWSPKFKFTKNTVVRGGYGINYNTGQYATFASKLAFQQPFAVTQTNTLNTATSPTDCLLGVMTLTNGFGCSTQTTQSNYAVNPNYRLGYVQVFNVDIQRSLPQGIVLNVGYTGSLGGNLDMLRAPNRTATGVIDPTVNQFTYEDSVGFQRSNTLAVNARKRLQKGISLQATYTFSHSIDNASSIGGSGSSIAQNDQDLQAEESNSSFTVRQKVAGNWILELPFGPNRAFLNKGGVWSKIMDGYSVSGTYTFATGGYATPSYAGTTAEIVSGAGSSLRPDLVPGQSITGARTLKNWFNTAAFAAPAAGTYGTAARNSIELPGTVSINGSLSRTVQLGDTRSIEARITANNAFNTVQYAGVYTSVNSANFGQVSSAAAMRSLTYLVRFRF